MHNLGRHSLIRANNPGASGTFDFDSEVTGLNVAVAVAIEHTITRQVGDTGSTEARARRISATTWLET